MIRWFDVGTTALPGCENEGGRRWPISANDELRFPQPYFPLIPFQQISGLPRCGLNSHRRLHFCFLYSSLFSMFFCSFLHVIRFPLDQSHGLSLVTSWTCLVKINLRHFLNGGGHAVRGLVCFLILRGSCSKIFMHRRRWLRQTSSSATYHFDSFEAATELMERRYTIYSDRPEFPMMNLCVFFTNHWILTCS